MKRSKMNLICWSVGFLAFVAAGCRKEERRTAPPSVGEEQPFMDPTGGSGGDPPGLSKGKDLFSQKSFTAALREFDEYARLNPEDARGHYYRSICLQALDRNDEALKALEKAVERKPDFPEKHNNLAGLYMMQKDFDGGIRVLEVAIKSFPSDGSLWYNLGLARLYNNRSAAAAQALDKAAASGATAPGVFLAAGIAYLKSGSPVDALNRFLKVLEGGNVNAGAEEGAAKALLALRRPKEALKHARKAVELSPENPARLYLLGVAHLALGNHESALDALARAAERSPKNSTIQMRRAEALFHSGKNKLALRVVKIADALAQDERDELRGEIQLLLGEIQAAMNSCRSALKALEKAGKLMGNNPEFLDRLEKAVGLCRK